MAILEEPIRGVPIIKNFIDGEWVESKGEIMDVVNPVKDEIIAKVGMSTKEETDAAVKAAQEAYPDWRRTPAVTRARYLYRLRELLEENFEELSRVQTQEHGKTIDESRGEKLYPHLFLRYNRFGSNRKFLFHLLYLFRWYHLHLSWKGAFFYNSPLKICDHHWLHLRKR